MCYSYLRLLAAILHDLLAVNSCSLWSPLWATPLLGRQGALSRMGSESRQSFRRRRASRHHQALGKMKSTGNSPEVKRNEKGPYFCNTMLLF